MATRRAPLADRPNAVNSPYRNVPSMSGKRTRAQAGDQKETIYGQPPIKKQIIEAQTHAGEENVDPRRRNGLPVTVSGNKLDELFSKARPNHAPTALEKKFASVRSERKPASHQSRERSQKHHGEGYDMKVWQKQFRKQFPGFVFYFDNVPASEFRSYAVRAFRSLGAREEMFFSNAVTHVVTTRSIPSDQPSAAQDIEVDAILSKPSQQPALAHDHRRTANLLEANLQRRSQQPAISFQPHLDTRRSQAQGADILARAKELGIKIWTVEKLERVLKNVSDPDRGDETYETRNHAAPRLPRQVQKVQDVTDLEQMLRHEKVNGPADRDMTVATSDMATLRGLYIYVHDMDEKTKPVMVRDYSEPKPGHSGKWPQFRDSGSGRCPFVEDPQRAKKLQEAKARQELAQRQTRADSVLPAAPVQALADHEVHLRRSPRKLAQTQAQAQAVQHEMGKPLNPSVPAARRQSSAEMPPLFGSAQASLRSLPRIIRGEPVASGVQRSSVTSAIRSQVVSSAAISSTAPGFNRRIGDTKEVSLLKRKVLASNNSIPSSHVHDVRAAINEQADPPPRAAKRKAQETLGVVHEHEEDAQGNQLSKSKSTATKRVKVAPKEAKPGYCENCRDKYDDFDEHIVSRKHRKFATTQDNWEELDSLLLLLKRPHKNAK